MIRPDGSLSCLISSTLDRTDVGVMHERRGMPWGRPKSQGTCRVIAYGSRAMPNQLSAQQLLLVADEISVARPQPRWPALRNLKRRL